MGFGLPDNGAKKDDDAKICKKAVDCVESWKCSDWKLLHDCLALSRIIKYRKSWVMAKKAIKTTILYTT